MRIDDFEVPVDAEEHSYSLHGEIVHVAMLRAKVMTVWTLSQPGAPAEVRLFAVPDGDVQDNASYVRTALHGGRAYHLFQR